VSPRFAEKRVYFESMTFLDKGSDFKNENKHVPPPPFSRRVTVPGMELVNTPILVFTRASNFTKKSDLFSPLGSKNQMGYCNLKSSVFRRRRNQFSLEVFINHKTAKDNIWSAYYIGVGHRSEFDFGTIRRPSCIFRQPS